MPLYDRQCACGWTATDVWEAVNAGEVRCPECGAMSERAWLTKATTVHGDECDFVQHNGTREPIRFRSRAEFKRWLKQEGYTIKDSHVPKQGTDKSPFTTNWAASYDPYTAENVRILLERAFHQSSDEEPPLNMNITTYTGELSPEEARKYVGR